MMDATNTDYKKPDISSLINIINVLIQSTCVASTQASVVLEAPRHRTVGTQTHGTFSKSQACQCKPAMMSTECQVDIIEVTGASILLLIHNTTR